MKLLNFIKDEKVYLGINTPFGIIDVEETVKRNGIDAPLTMEMAIMEGIEKLIPVEKSDGAIYLKEQTVTFAPVVQDPQKILCIGVNYRKHAEETHLPIPQFPVVFGKYNNALAAHNQKINLPKGPGKFDYEAELVIVIGKKACCVSEEEALDYVFGYTIGNDLTSRELQFKTNQWLIGKNCDQFAPLGPWIVSAEEIDPQCLEICCKVNEEVRQHSNTNDMIFSCAQIISILSHSMTLYPGDLIFTGTPEGVILGYPEDKQEWLKPGDKMQIFIQHIGVLYNELC